MEFGDAASAFALLDEVEKGTELGRALAAGVVATAKFLGVTRVPAFRGQAIPAHDPRVTKATGVTYQTSPMGADHTAGISYEKAMSKEGQVERSLMAQIFNAMIDSLGYCNLAAPGSRMVLTTFLKDLINARYGLKLTEDDLIQIGRDTLRTELAFNRTSGFLTAHEKAPAFIFTEASAPTGSVFDVDPAEIAGMWDKLDSTSIAPIVVPG
jgi:aldehyde:ferredoxin oxidoreductase